MESNDIFDVSRIVIAAAHPDDEVVGAGAQLPRLGARLWIVHVTDGAPRNLEDARRAGFSTREAYAAARIEESLSAAAHAEIAPSQFQQLGFADQEAALALEQVTQRLREVLSRAAPDIVLTHPYEGGHPDHDATAFGVHLAVAMMDRAGSAVPEIWEFTSYHAGPEGMESGRFLGRQGGGHGDEAVYALTAEQRELKERMLASFVTQMPMLHQFRVDEERFRRAPQYDFFRPPHPRRLHYENFDWGMTGARFCELALRASQGLGVHLNHVAHDS